MSTLASQITSLTIVCSTVYSTHRSKKTSKPRVTGLCAGNSPVTGEFHDQRATNAKKVSTWWHHHHMLSNSTEIAFFYWFGESLWLWKIMHWNKNCLCLSGHMELPTVIIKPHNLVCHRNEAFDAFCRSPCVVAGIDMFCCLANVDCTNDMLQLTHWLHSTTRRKRLLQNHYAVWDNKAIETG